MEPLNPGNNRSSRYCKWIIRRLQDGCGGITRNQMAILWKVNTESYQILYTGSDDGRHLLSKAINERICTIRFERNFNNISMINIYAPTEDSEGVEKLYSMLS